jgi:hypothetical protein
MKKFTLLVVVALSLPPALMAQSTTGSSGTGTTEPGPSAAEASGFGNTRRTPSVTGNTIAPRGTGSISSQTAIAESGATTTYPGSSLTADALFQKLDTNGDGQLTREEFAKFQSVLGATENAGTRSTGARNGSSTGAAPRSNPGSSGGTPKR